MSKSPTVFTKGAVWSAIIVLVVAAMFLTTYRLSTPRIFLNERRALISIRQLKVAENHYAARYGDKGFACKIADLVELSNSSSKENHVDSVLLTGASSQYSFELTCAQRGTLRGRDYTITAAPIRPGVSGQRGYCTHQGADIWYSENGWVGDCLVTRKRVEEQYYKIKTGD